MMISEIYDDIRDILNKTEKKSIETTGKDSPLRGGGETEVRGGGGGDMGT